VIRNNPDYQEAEPAVPRETLIADADDEQLQDYAEAPRYEEEEEEVGDENEEDDMDEA